MGLTFSNTAVLMNLELESRGLLSMSYLSEILFHGVGKIQDSYICYFDFTRRTLVLRVLRKNLKDDSNFPAISYIC